MEVDKDLILRYQRCEATPEEEDALLDYLDESEEHRREFDKSNFLYCAAILNANKEKKRIAHPWFLWSVAAALLIVLSLGIGVLVHKLGEEPQAQYSVSEVTIEAPPDSRARITLPDGTVVWLNSCSRLTYPESFNRSVKLEGEGCFDVVSNGLPFSVSAAGISVEVLGTVFNLRAYKEEGKVETVLASGSVRLYDADGNQLFLLRPGDKVSCDTDGNEIEAMQVDAWKLLLDTYGIITLPDVSLTELCSVLDKVYGVKILVIEDDGTPLTFNFAKDDTLDEVVSRLETLSGKKFHISK